MSLLQDASLVLTPNAYTTSKLYSIIPSSGNGDFTFFRAGSATETASNGLIEDVPYNLVQYSEEFSNGYWGKTSGTITPNVTTTVVVPERAHPVLVLLIVVTSKVV